MMREEKDVLGTVLVPPDKYYGAQTQRACENFRVGTERFSRDLIQAHALVKRCTAVVNCEMGQLEQQLSEAIVQAADEVIAGKFDDHFPLVIWQSGSGTQFNMNVNEVIANRAIELLGGEIGTKDPVHPNDHVNMSQSTNDTMPTSMHIAAVTALKEKLLPNLAILIGVLEHKAREFKEIIKIGRTHLQDATPLSLGQEFWGYAAQLEIGMEALERALEHLYELPIGATAVGTGINSPDGFDEKMVQEISIRGGYTFKTARSKFAALAGHEAVVNASGAMKTIAVALMKIANDLRWLASGPRCGLGELTLPANEPGSSIMPGKVNPTQCEMITMVACQVIGNDAAITMAGSQGNFELNVYKPLLANSLLQSINLLADAIKSFNEKCVTGIKPNLKKIAEHLNNSLMLVTALNKHIGYDKAAEIALKAWQEEKTLKQAALESGYLSEEQFDLWVCPEEMTQPDNNK
ncbi:MAG: class II fumarate hydratase [Sedimentisphaerales bacterium]|nr:class II fumarate hydratase [Sedimentisphaerales bacterium]